MDLKSYSRWDDYTRARDAMFAATDTAWAPWYVAHSDDKRRARLNIISHLLDQIRYKAPPGEKVKLPKRKTGKYRSPAHRYKRLPGVGGSRRIWRLRAPVLQVARRAEVDERAALPRDARTIREVCAGPRDDPVLSARGSALRRGGRPLGRGRRRSSGRSVRRARGLRAGGRPV